MYNIGQSTVFGNVANLERKKEKKKYGKRERTSLDRLPTGNY